MSDAAEVTEVTQRTTTNGIEVELTVRRDWRVFVGIKPRVEDVPQDIRDALTAWLAGGAS